MELELLWYVLAGFILGFIVSTLWEWLHFRRERQTRQAMIMSILKIYCPGSIHHKAIRVVGFC